MYRQKFLCVNQDDLEIYGSFSSQKAKLLRVYLELCHGEENSCASENEIVEYMKDKYLLFLTNQIRFDSKEYSEESIVKESRVDWIRVSTKQPFEQPYSVKKTQL